MIEMSELAKNTKGSMIRKMFNATVGMNNLLNFTVGQPDFTTPQPIVERAVLGLKQGKTHYTANRGIPELLQEIANFHNEEMNSDPEQNILVTGGAGEALQLALLATVNPGDEVILFTPAWPNYFGQLEIVGAKTVLVSTREEDQFAPDPDAIRSAISSSTKAIIINSPCNPTGAVIPPDVMLEIAKIIEGTNIFVIVDEVYRNIVYDEEAFASLTSYHHLRDQLIFINSFSKMFAMTGWRIGYAIARPDIIDQMTKLHENGISCIFEPLQMAAAEGLRSCMPDVANFLEIYRRRRDLIVSGINSINGLSCNTPKGAFYAFININAFGSTSEEFCMELLQKTQCVTVPGIGFGPDLDNYMRVSYATSEENIAEFLRRLAVFSDEKLGV